MQNSPCLKTLIKHTSLVSLGFVAIIIIINCMLDKKLLVFRLFFGFMFVFCFFFGCAACGINLSFPTRGWTWARQWKPTILTTEQQVNSYSKWISSWLHCWMTSVACLHSTLHIFLLVGPSLRSSHMGTCHLLTERNYRKTEGNTKWI